MSDFVFRSVGGAEDRSAGKKGGVRIRMKAVKWFFIVFALIFVIEALVYLVVIPSMQTATVIWSGAASYSQEYLSRVISPLSDRSWMRFSKSEAFSLLSSVSGIEDVQIVKRFPDKVYINVVERTPVAMTFVDVGSRTVPIQIDKNGVLFTLQTSQPHSSSIPLVSGIPIESVPGGMRVPSKYRGLLEQISAIGNLSQNYFAAISEIHIVPKESGNYELVLYPIHSRTRILTGRQLTEEALQYMMVALDVVNTLESDVEEIDLGYGSIAYRTRRSSGDSF